MNRLARQRGCGERRRGRRTGLVGMVGVGDCVGRRARLQRPEKARPRFVHRRGIRPVPLLQLLDIGGRCAVQERVFQFAQRDGGRRRGNGGQGTRRGQRQQGGARAWGESRPAQGRGGAAEGGGSEHGGDGGTGGQATRASQSPAVSRCRRCADTCDGRTGGARGGGGQPESGGTNACRGSLSPSARPGARECAGGLPDLATREGRRKGGRRRDRGARVGRRARAAAAALPTPPPATLYPPRGQAASWPTAWGGRTLAHGARWTAADAAARRARWGAPGACGGPFARLTAFSRHVWLSRLENRGPRGVVGRGDGPPRSGSDVGRAAGARRAQKTPPGSA